MKRYTHRIFVIAAAAALAFAAALAGYLVLGRSRPSGEPVKYRTVSAAGTAGRAASAEPADRREKLSSAIELGPAETLLDLYTANIDLDDEEEQILVVKKSDAASSPVRVVVADFSQAQRKWIRAWEGETAATKIKTVQVTVKDLIGDRNQNIICSGMNDGNKQTLTVFWRSDSGPTFKKIFEAVSDSVVVEETDRPESYKLGQTNGESWAISTYDSDPASTNFLDQVRRSWTWSFSRKQYVMSSEERIPGARIAAKMSESLLDGKPETFEAFLEGIWYLDTVQPGSPQAQFLSFQPRDRGLFFAGEGVIELYEWETSNPTRYGLYVACRNQSIKDLRRLMNIELAGADTIRVSVFQDLRMKVDVSDRWNGTYRKLGYAEAASLKRPAAASVVPVADLEGTFTSPSGEELFFSAPKYTRRKGGATIEEGSFSVFKLAGGTTVLDMKSQPAAGSQEAGRRYSYELSLAERPDNKVTRLLLSLKPVRVGMSGAVATEDPTVVYERAKTR